MHVSDCVTELFSHVNSLVIKEISHSSGIFKNIAAAAVDALTLYLFVLGCISRYSAGSVYYYQSYHHKHNPVQVEKLQKELKRYLTRKIGFEAVMRIRCTKGLDVFIWGQEQIVYGGVEGEEWAVFTVVWE